MASNTTLKIASALLLSLAALGAARADTVPGDKYGYVYRQAASADTYGYGLRGKVSGDDYGYTFRSHDVFTDGARKVAGLDRSSVSSEPARSFDPYQEGARARTA
ncbi:hypothetical protein BKK79_30380 [Cupriavidus sp. USMAA2-4]|uniref:hypothetical protein n=1 Tax=Cupriavidus sp. USMAA2-4 TaxID=876364 RepID=UPI0008A6F826|nr:hypothetical protein [Cupriavidus sp. USMAA2-4]AOY95975.1 hypothetical protein BKK79_30380 [Cupriavidus sp. USMAA2-4]